MILVFAMIFAVAQQTRRITHSAEALHSADEALRVATTARAQIALGVVVANVDLVVGSNSSEQLEISRSETESALVLLANALSELESRRTLDGSLREAVERFTIQGQSVLGLMAANDPIAARSVAETDLDKAWTLLQLELVRERDQLNAEVASSDAFLAWMRMLAGFLVAFLVPTAVILIFREFARRQAKQTDLEGTLRTERELGKAREDFVANASHELRTPLTSIYGLALMLEEDPAVVESDSAKEMINMIVSESTDLSRMVDDLLTTARLDADALHYTFENVEIIEEIEEVVGPMLRGGLDIAVSSVEATIRVDRLRFRQILRNLISNARKYGGPNLSVSAEVVGERFMMSVTDDGDGIPEDLESRLFQRFMHQGHQPLILGSVGLGLSIVRALADGMGGSVQYVRENGLTKFMVVMPLVSASKPSVAPLSRTTLPSGYHDPDPVSLDIAASEPYREPGGLP
ncbi:MAG: HAMP domain-containing histidine kinase [Acidimicrobiia bacterium]|nr:HAMP domain-containing histidine kinase [Acidimicrobiia bacterium]